MMQYYLLILTGLFYVVSGNPAQYKDCGSKASALKGVDITPCEGPVCLLERGTNVTIKVTFEPNKVIKTTKVIVHGIIAGVPVPFPVPQVDACEKSGLTCPLQSQQQYTYHTILVVQKDYPKIKLLVKWEMQDETGEDVFCWEIPAQIN